MTVVAAFDFDGTLTTGDCVVPFLRRARGSTRFAMGMVRPALVPALLRRDRDRLKAIAARAALRDLDAADLHAAGQTFAAHVAGHRMRRDTLGRLHWHLGCGHEVVLVSASFEVYLAPLSELLGARAALGTRLEVTDGRCTGRLLGANCRGPEKVRRLHDWLGTVGLARRDIELWAYGDSTGDRELLAEADHPVWVRGPVRVRGTVAPVPDGGPT